MRLSVLGAKALDPQGVLVLLEPAHEPDVRRRTLDPFVRERIAEGATVYTDENPAYDAVPNREAVAHGRGEYVRGDCHINEGGELLGRAEAGLQGHPPQDERQAHGPLPRRA